MKKIFSILLLMCVFTAAYSQTRLTAPLVRNFGSDTTYGTHIDTLGYGGFMVFTDTIYRNEIPFSMRKIGMIATVDTTMYQLTGCISNDCWRRLIFDGNIYFRDNYFLVTNDTVDLINVIDSLRLTGMFIEARKNDIWIPMVDLNGLYSLQDVTDVDSVTTHGIKVANNITINNGVTYDSTNFAIGQDVLTVLTTGKDNVGIGRRALQNNTTGNSNIAIGKLAMRLNQTSPGNVAIGDSAFYNGQGAGFNTAIGYRTLIRNISGYQNTAIGVAAIRDNTTGYNNTAVGAAALAQNTIGYWNTAVGEGALFRNTTGDHNTAIGEGSASNLVDGVYNSSFGTSSLLRNVSGDYNVAFGTKAMYESDGLDSSTAIGAAAMYGNSGSGNTAIGSQAMYYNISGGATGSRNVAIGQSALSTLFSGNFNTAIGWNTSDGITTGSNNTIIGARVTGLGANLNNNLVIADGTGRYFISADSSRHLKFGGYGTGVNTGTLAYTLGVDASGNVIETSGSGGTTTLQQAITASNLLTKQDTINLQNFPLYFIGDSLSSVNNIISAGYLGGGGVLQLNKNLLALGIADLSSGLSHNTILYLRNDSAIINVLRGNTGTPTNHFGMKYDHSYMDKPLYLKNSLGTSIQIDNGSIAPDAPFIRVANNFDNLSVQIQANAIYFSDSSGLLRQSFILNGNNYDDQGGILYTPVLSNNTIAVGAEVNGVTTYTDTLGVIRLGTISGGSTPIIEQVTGSTSTTITLAHTPIAGSYWISKNGIDLPDAEFTQTGTSVTLNSARLTGDIYRSHYNY